MPKISKNIKKLRTERNLTQDALATKIHVTRQAISNWENDKTKPDIEALEKLAEVFGVDIEELIYGEKKEVIISQEKTTEKNRIKIILAIVGSLLVASGLALVFFGFWQNLSVVFQTIFSLIPMILGQVFAIYTFTKKKESVSWRESASIIWSIGVIATIALLNGIHNINLGYINCLAIDAFLIIPIMFLFNTISPLVFILYSSIHIGVDGLWQYILISVVIYIISIVFTVAMRRKEDARAVFAQWVTVITSIPLIWIYSIVLYELEIMIDTMNVFISIYLIAFLCMYIFTSDKSSYVLPYKPISILGICVTASFLSETFYNDFFRTDSVAMVITNIAFILAIPLIVALIKRESFENNIKKILISALPFLVMTLNFTHMLIVKLAEDFITIPDFVRKILLFAVGVVVVAFGVVLVYAGIKELRLFLINAGLITAFAQVVRLIYSDLVPDSYLLKGIILVIFGAIIIVINWKMLSVKKSIQEQSERGDENA